MAQVTAPPAPNLRQVGIRLSEEQITELRALGSERGEDFSTALRLVLRIGLREVLRLKAEGAFV